MSLSDITLNSKVYSVSSVQGQKVVRNCTAATLPVGLDSASLEMSHTPGIGSKPDRHLVKFTTNVVDATSGKSFPYTVHAVVTIPKGVTKAARNLIIGGDNSMSDDIASLIALDTWGFVPRLANGEFS